jgi:hypothetical protein
MLGKLLRGEITQWPSIVELGNLFQTDVFKKLEQGGLDLQSLISLGGQNAQQTGLNALALQKGELPPEDVAQLFRTSAMQNLQSGLFGSSAGTANQLRNYGIGMVQGQQTGASLSEQSGNAAQRWAQIAMGTVLPDSSQLYTPDWFTNYMAEQEAAREAQKQRQFNAAAAPDPAAAGIAGTVTGIIGAIYGHGGGGNYSDYAGQYNKATASNVPPTSQFSGVGGTISNALGGNLHWGGDQPYAFTPNNESPGRTDTFNPNLINGPAQPAPAPNTLPPSYNPITSAWYDPFNPTSNIG